MTSVSTKSPYIVPPFDQGNRTTVRFVWWSWHPAHVKPECPSGWSPMVWEEKTEEAAMKLLEEKGFPNQYHVKLIRHGNSFTEMYDRPCPDVSGWHTFRHRRRESGVETLAVQFENPDQTKTLCPKCEAVVGEGANIHKCATCECACCTACTNDGPGNTIVCDDCHR